MRPNGNISVAREEKSIPKLDPKDAAADPNEFFPEDLLKKGDSSNKRKRQVDKQVEILTERNNAHQYEKHVVDDLIILNDALEEIEVKDINRHKKKVDDVFNYFDNIEPLFGVPVAVKWRHSNMYYIATATKEKPYSTGGIHIGSEHQADIPTPSLFQNMKSRLFSFVGAPDPYLERTNNIKDVLVEEEDLFVGKS